MGHKYYPIKGIPIQGAEEGIRTDTPVPVRREVNDFFGSNDREDKIRAVLFVLALQRFQQMSPKSRDSYFQIAGIHGMPFESWDEPSLTAQEKHRKGYCVHANALFPLWHRPYLLLYEQRIYENMLLEIEGMALDEVQRRRYLKAASEFRLPFWDWATNPTLPKIMRQETLTIVTENQPERVIENPLYKFKMPHGEKMSVYRVGSVRFPEFADPLEYGECSATSRCPEEKERDPTKEDWIKGVVHSKKVDDYFTQHSSVADFDHGTIKEMIYRLLTYPMDFVTFATTARDATVTSASKSNVMHDMNIEFIHNNIHYWVGGDGGHMSQIPVATFDPIFWFHHCNLDRLFAIWQTLHPEEWFNADFTRPFDLKVIGMGPIVTNKTPFRPFHKDQEGTVWTVEDARDWYQWGYTYPELQRRKDVGDPKVELLRTITETYGFSRKEALGMVDTGSELSGLVEKTEAGAKSKDYAVSIKYSRFALGGHPFNLEVYLHPEGETAETYRAEEFVTSVYNFSQPSEQDGETVCSNCSELEAQDVQVVAYIPVTSYLVKMVQQKRLQDLQPLTVEEFLKGIYYRVTAIGNTVAEENWKPTMNLKVDVSVTEMDYSNEPSTLPKCEVPKTIPSLGIGGEVASNPAAIPGFYSQYITVDDISPLPEAISVGGSIIITSPSINIQKPPRGRESKTNIQLIFLDANTGNTNNRESHDVLLDMTIMTKLQILSCTSKKSGSAPSGELMELKPTLWFQENNPNIRVDVGADEFVVYVNGNKVGEVDRAIKGRNVTHVGYWKNRDREPVMGNGITVTSYKQTNLVP